MNHEMRGYCYSQRQREQRMDYAKRMGGGRDRKERKRGAGRGGGGGVCVTMGAVIANPLRCVRVK